MTRQRWARWLGRAAPHLLAALLGLQAAAPTAATTFEDLYVLYSGRYLAFRVVSEAAWDETAVRKVLHTFAFGGHASDAQIKAWADMHPLFAIREMLTLEPFNPQIAPADPDTPEFATNGTLAGLAALWSSNAPENPVPAMNRVKYDLRAAATSTAAETAWRTAATRFGLNPFRHKLGLWETNYHLAVNLQASGVNGPQVVGYYDDILGALGARLPYEQVLTRAALSAAIATQYGHRKSVYSGGVFKGNEDFGREYHQLFFGIQGEYDPAYHEAVTVKNTAQALSGITVPKDPETGWLSATSTCSASKHVPYPLEILHSVVSGTDACERLSALGGLAVNQPESLEHLPAMIASGLADDELDPEEAWVLRQSWASLYPKDLLKFLQAYAISTTFHSPRRVKAWSSVERHLLLNNLQLQNNREADLDLFDSDRYATHEGVKVFRPIHDVFGGQTGPEAAGSAEVFRQAYKRSTENYALNARKTFSQAGTVVWEADWARAVPAATGYRVREVTEWLWQRFVADGLKNLGSVERAHLYALLAGGLDLGWTLSGGADPERVYRASDLAGGAMAEQVAALGEKSLALASADTAARRAANERVGQAVNFITATPYFFLQEGR